MMRTQNGRYLKKANIKIRGERSDMNPKSWTLYYSY